MSSTASRAWLRLCLLEVGRGAEQQRPAVVAAEHAGEDAEAFRRPDLLDDLAARRDAPQRAADRVGRPDVLLGVERAAVGAVLELGDRLLERTELRREAHLAPDPAVGKRAVVSDRERRVAGAGGLADDQRLARPA